MTEAVFQFSWDTSKTDTGLFVGRVTKWAYQVPAVTMKTATFPTRARAEGYAKRWVRYFRATAKQGV